MSHRWIVKGRNDLENLTFIAFVYKQTSLDQRNNSEIHLQPYNNLF